MKRHMVIYLFTTLFIGLGMVLFVFGCLPLAAETLHLPAGLTETFTPAPTNTLVALNTNTPVPLDTNTPVPLDTNTPVPLDTNTPIPVITNTPAPTATNTPAAAATDTPAPTATNRPTAPAIVGFPDTGGASPQSGASRWVLVVLAGIVGSLGALVFRLNRRVYRPTRR